MKRTAYAIGDDTIAHVEAEEPGQSHPAFRLTLIQLDYNDRAKAAVLVLGREDCRTLRQLLRSLPELD